MHGKRTPEQHSKMQITWHKMLQIEESFTMHYVLRNLEFPPLLPLQRPAAIEDKNENAVPPDAFDIED